jgi:hypothetical protein
LLVAYGKPSTEPARERVISYPCGQIGRENRISSVAGSDSKESPVSSFHLAEKQSSEINFRSGTRNFQYFLAVVVSLLTFWCISHLFATNLSSGTTGSMCSGTRISRSIDVALFRWAFFNFHAANWHPHWLSHALDYAVWGLNPLGHHLTNNLLHALNTFLVVVLTMRLLEAWKKKTTKCTHSVFTDDRAILMTGTVTGLLFGLHPLHVESVAWIAERKDLLCAAFFLLSIAMYVRYVDVLSTETAQRECRSTFVRRQYLCSLGLFGLAVLSKPMAVSLTAVLFILDWYPLNRIRSLPTFWPVLYEKIPSIALSIGIHHACCPGTRGRTPSSDGAGASLDTNAGGCEIDCCIPRENHFS